MNIINQIDAEIARLQDAKQVLARFVLGREISPAPRPAVIGGMKPTRKCRATVGSGDAVVLSAIRDGADTTIQIMAGAKVGHSAVKQALKRLLASKQVRAEGSTSNRRYLAA